MFSNHGQSNGLGKSANLSEPGRGAVQDCHGRFHSRVLTAHCYKGHLVRGLIGLARRQFSGALRKPFIKVLRCQLWKPRSTRRSQVGSFACVDTSDSDSTSLRPHNFVMQNEAEPSITAREHRVPPAQPALPLEIHPCAEIENTFSPVDRLAFEEDVYRHGRSADSMRVEVIAH